MNGDVIPLLPAVIGRGKVKFARGVEAGPWVFATGQMATDYKEGFSTQVLDAAMPYRGPTKNEKEASLIFDNIDDVLKAGNSSLRNVVRLDQYYPRHEAVDPYHIVRRSRLGGVVPASTSVLVKKLLFPSAEMEAECIAVRADAGVRIEHFDDPRFKGHPSSAFSAAVRAGDFVFVPGVVASALPGEPHRNGMAPEALIVEGSLWKGCPIVLETEYCLKRKIEPSLALAGSSLRNIVKAQVYLTHLDDVGPFLNIWNKYFSENPPALTVILLPKPGFATYQARTEINVIALTDGGATKKQVIETDVPSVLRGAPSAVRAGNLLFLSGLYAADDRGLVAEAKREPEAPYFSSAALEQSRTILRNAQKICSAAGTSLTNTVRLQQFQTDLCEFYEAHMAWQECVPNCPCPFSAVEVATTMPLPGATMMADIWVYAP